MGNHDFNGVELNSDAIDGMVEMRDSVERGEIETDDDALLVDRLESLAAAITPTAHFSSTMKEILMTTLAMPSDRRDMPHRGLRTHARDVNDPSWSQVHPRHLRRGFQRATAAIVTALFLFITIGGIFSLQRTPNNGDQLNAPGPAPTASPSTGCLNDQDQDTSAPGAGINLLPLSAISGGAQYANFVQLQSWAVGPGVQAVVKPGPFGQFTALAVDFVLQGYYSATFNGPGIVSSRNLTGAPGTKLVDAGATVDLSHGDAISFNYSDGIAIQNLSKSVQLEFQRALFTKDVAAAPPSSGDGFTGLVEVSAQLPSTLDLMSTQTPMIWLTYVPVEFSDNHPRPFCMESTRFRLVSTVAIDRPANGEPNGYILYMARGGLG